ncbi:MAG: thiamine-phosphate kinase [Calditerrivibrio sp.]|nr:thiamine-phosphate kinase [Calditerrivibrio sp.]
MKEFHFISKLKEDIDFKTLPDFIGIGDDAALIGDMLIAKDIIVSDIHFKLDAGLENIIFKLITSNVSDICAMGGTSPFYGLFGVSSDGTIDMDRLRLSLKKSLGYYGVTLIGGDTTGSKSGLFLSFTIIGKRNRFVLKRGGAKAGDILFLSRPVGLSRVSLERELGIAAYEIDQFLHYKNIAEVKLGDFLGRSELVTSCIDISDGLGRDLGHISETSGCRIVIYESMLDTKHLEKFRLSSPIDYFLTSGEEYALAFTVDGERVEEFQSSLKNFPDVMMIGKVFEGNGVFLMGSDGSLIDISKYGYEHF